MAEQILTQKELRQKYRLQKSMAKRRSIEWKLTYEEWLSWWGEDINRRGRNADSLQMQRLHDKGAYEIGNIIKGHPKRNAATKGNCMVQKSQEELAREHQARLDAMMFEPSLEPEDEDMINVYEQEMKSNGTIAYTKYFADK
jgi:hypothetical protein